MSISSNERMFDLVEYPGREIIMSRVLEEGVEESNSAARGIALDALYDTLGEYSRPLSFEILYSYWDELEYPLSLENAHPPAGMFATSDSLSGLIRSPSYSPKIAFVDGDLRREVVDACIDSVDSACVDVDGYSLGWYLMEVRSSMAVIPGMTAGPSEVTVSRNAAQVSLNVTSVGEELWGYGPQDVFLEPPIGVRISRMNGTLTLQLGLYWSVWFEGGSGESYIRKGISKLERNGWVRSL
ncbi:Uncharacterised protein [Nocardia asteroides]|nr:hypothetical protein SAMN05444423_101615 [Nocardia asteroides]VEG31481.1 Uncharacterised protein [Nocardia asteroides]